MQSSSLMDKTSLFVGADMRDQINKRTNLLLHSSAAAISVVVHASVVGILVVMNSSAINLMRGKEILTLENHVPTMVEIFKALECPLIHLPNLFNASDVSKRATWRASICVNVNTSNRGNSMGKAGNCSVNNSGGCGCNLVHNSNSGDGITRISSVAAASTAMSVACARLIAPLVALAIIVADLAEAAATVAVYLSSICVKDSIAKSKLVGEMA
ncbi:hypothetical protein GGI26_004032 [Coemansia sp. RSA 1358]|uniref:Uncharacterized protein n=1 Tax=Coemansia umbellata TaxID=1424467 RepID=A0ABQ8PL56_9FUNG|nr:hypothetical protein EDC05_003401 [Coemansia umbellata]KAJ2621569.1 hypothetical protein GGI26_004032 [Coemansia sp. RSA 1358]